MHHHDAYGTDTDPIRRGRDEGGDDFGRGARHQIAAVMLGEPNAFVPEAIA